ncbi:hypothetical protein [Methylobacterium sp. yr596]|uniref:hypothetical protein n=1 Tax=Methylobacterium sp. yr596 TaxID=1761800 RepID=UPI0008F043BA|nr:hypothetical protein [Methylobacterium sp. yr596]SFF69479.1 hypothetical protein SAMN04487844_13911 [Methylobacterium sp. yr596]
MSGTAEPTWSRPPPAVPSSPSLTRLGRWGRWLFKGGGPVGRAASAIFDASPTAMPWVDEVPRDDFERALFAKARELEAQGIDRDEILKWFRGEGVAHAKNKAEDENKEKKKSSARSENVRISGKTNKKELCEVACECLKNRGRHATYQACVAEKLRDRYYDPKSGQHPAGGPRRPMSPTADGPRPEVSYKKGPDDKYAPVESQTSPGMPSTAPVVRGAPRPDVSWWSGGRLTEIWEMKFPTTDGGVDGQTDAQRAGRYRDIAQDQSIGRSHNDRVKINTIDVKRDCKCEADS